MVLHKTAVRANYGIEQAGRRDTIGMESSSSFNPSIFGIDDRASDDKNGLGSH